MTDFETHPVGTAKRIADLEQRIKRSGKLIFDQNGEIVAQRTLLEKYIDKGSELYAEIERLREANENNLAGWMNETAHLQVKIERLRIPEGWKMVPVEPTYDMAEAGTLKRWNWATRNPDSSREIYKAMLKAAPEPHK